jgi:hypothetical protein
VTEYEDSGRAITTADVRPAPPEPPGPPERPVPPDPPGDDHKPDKDKSKDEGYPFSTLNGEYTGDKHPPGGSDQ